MDTSSISSPMLSSLLERSDRWLRQEAEKTVTAAWTRFTRYTVMLHSLAVGEVKSMCQLLQ